MKKNKAKKITNDFGKFLESSKLEYLPHVLNYIVGDLSLIKSKVEDIEDEDEEETQKVIEL